MNNFVQMLLRNYGDSDGEDIIQDVMLSISRSLDITLSAQQLAAYVYKSLRNKVVDTFRKKRLNKVSLDSLSNNHEENKRNPGSYIKDERSDIHNRMVSDYLIDSLYAALGKCSTGEKEIIISSEICGQSVTEMARTKGVPEGTLRARKSRAMKKLYKILNQGGHL